jgi:hypothetical protein
MQRKYRLPPITKEVTVPREKKYPLIIPTIMFISETWFGVIEVGYNNFTNTNAIGLNMYRVSVSSNTACLIDFL